ncbi:tpr domain protein [Apiospora saccharicola]|uniref:Tpr domain protein n=1 Tax=Apiospora saccharicola TaxID=335842 RepID=A0ABR1UDP1_9PEZI
MSGTEVIGIISAVIAIIDGIHQLYEGASDATGLPEAFRVVAARLPLVESILQSVENHLRLNQVDGPSSHAMKAVLHEAKKKAKSLKELFDKVIPLDDASRWDRYIKLARTLGKDTKVETLMMGLMTDVQLLMGKNGLDSVAAQQVDELRKAIEDMSKLQPSIPDSEFQNGTFTNAHYGTGDITIHHVAEGATNQSHYGSAPGYWVAGNMSIAIHERQETPPNPSSIIPFGRDKDFIPRGDILDRIHQACAIPETRIALVGLGGVGKSQLAIEYAHQVRQRSPDIWVFWVHASNATRYEQSLREIADHVKIPGRHDPQNNIFQLVRDWLRGGRDRRWRLILDNVDDANFLLAPPSMLQEGRASSAEDPNLSRLVDYLPTCENGSMLITSRSKGAVEDLVEGYNIIQVEPMNETESIALVEKKLGPEQDRKNTGALAAALERMPLAIVQATAYISKRAPRCSVRQYLEKFEQSDRKKASLLDYKAGKLRRDRDAKNSIIITWQISFDHIRQTRPSAADLLSLISFCDRQGIPKSLLRPLDEEDAIGDSGRQQHRPTLDSSSTYEESTDDDSESSSSGDDQLENDILALQDYSFISINKDGETFVMHSLVQLATRRWIEAEGQLEKWKSEFVRRLDVQLPTGAYENWATCRAFLPHAVSAAAQRPKNEASLKRWTSILYKAAWYLEMMGQGPEAQGMAEDAMKYRIKVFGRAHEESLNAIEMLGIVKMLRGQWEAAEKLFVEVMETRKQKLGPDHPSTLASMANLASTFWNQGRWEAAEKLEVEVIETRKQKLGPDHPSTLAGINNLASTFWNQGRWEAAEKLFMEVMETRKQKLGPDHPSTLTSIANLASTYRNQGRWEAAEKLFMEVIETRKQKLGPDHPSTLTSIANLALTYKNQGRWEAAEKLEALNILIIYLR